MTVELVPLCTFDAKLLPPHDLGKTPAGTRMIFDVDTGRIDGDRFSGKVKGQAAADWLTIGPDNIGTIDVRALVETDDGALVFVQYLGRVDLADTGERPLYISPRFETGDDRYRWLNKLVCVGKGKSDGKTIHYDVYEVR
jgi:hypothetical protein